MLPCPELCRLSLQAAGFPLDPGGVALDALKVVLQPVAPVDADIVNLPCPLGRLLRRSPRPCPWPRRRLLAAAALRLIAVAAGPRADLPGLRPDMDFRLTVERDGGGAVASLLGVLALGGERAVIDAFVKAGALQRRVLMKSRLGSPGLQFRV